MSKEKKSTINKRVEQKYLTLAPYDGVWGPSMSTQTYDTYTEAETQAQLSAHKSGEEVLIYQAIASADADVKNKVKVNQLT